MWVTAKRQWFLLALALVFVIGYVGSDAFGGLLQLSWLRYGIVMAVMWATGVTLRADAIRNSLLKPLPALLAIVINMLVVPLFVVPLGWLPDSALPTELFGGLFIAALVPCTLASAAVWTRKAGGDDSIALMTTVVTNLACVIVVPVGLWAALGQVVEISLWDQMSKLMFIVVLPLCAAQAMRLSSIGTWADRHRAVLGVAGQCGILSMVFFGAIASALMVKTYSAGPPWVGGLSVLVGASGIHLAALWLGVSGCRLIRLDRPTQIAVGFSGSQKTLMVGLQIALDCGLSVIPMIVYHLSQLLIDTIIADRWRRGHHPVERADLANREQN